MAIKARASVEIENPSIGGRNLLLKTNAPKTTSVAVDTTSHLLATYDLTEPPANGEMCTVTIKLSNWTGMTKWGAWNTNGGYELTSAGYWAMSSTQIAKDTFSLTFPWKNWDNAALNKTVLIYTRDASAACSPTVEWVKLEKGTKATDWTPAPEDVDSAISDLEDKTILNATALEQRLSSQILQTQEQIQQTVTEQYFTKDETNKLIQQVSTAFTQTAEGWQMDFNKLVSVVNANQAATDSEFQEWSKYIRFVDGNIILGAVANPVVLTIKNNRISFAQSGQEVAYLSNAELVITDARVTHSLIIGKFGLVPRANGSMDLKKVSS